MKNRLSKIFLNFRFVLILYILLALVTSFQSYFQGTKMYGDKSYQHYNNYTVFKQSFYHLLEGKSLYQLYPEEQFDLYKYSPAFSLLFGSLGWMPDIIGLSLWNLLNVLVLFFAIKRIPGITDKSKIWLSLFVVFEMVGSLQNSQSNALIAGLIILAFSFLENKKYFWASFFIVFSVFIKLFGIVAFGLYLFYPKKPKLILYTAIWFVFLLVVPLFVTSFSNLVFQYSEYGNMLVNDHTSSLGISIYGLLNSWFNINISKNYILLFGVLVFLLPLNLFKKYSDLSFRLLTLASILIWVIIFNHKAESPTFVIAMCGIGIYLFSGSFTKIKTGLLIFSLLFTSIMFQDFIPRDFKNDYVIAFNLKVLPSVVIWFVIIKEMLFGKSWPISQKSTLSPE